jgi:hypothetical protein
MIYGCFALIVVFMSCILSYASQRIIPFNQIRYLGETYTSRTSIKRFSVQEISMKGRKYFGHGIIEETGVVADIELDKQLVEILPRAKAPEGEAPLVTVLVLEVEPKKNDLPYIYRLTPEEIRFKLDMTDDENDFALPEDMDRMNESISFIYQIRLALIALSFTFLYINANVSILLSFAVVFISTLFVRPIRYTKGLKRDIIKPSKNKTVSQNGSPSKQDEKSQNDWKTPPKKFNEWTENARDLWNVNHNIQERKNEEVASEQQVSEETQESVPNVSSDTSDMESQEFFTQDEMDADAHEDVSIKYAETPSSVVNVQKQEMVSDVSSSDLGDTEGFDTEHANDDPFADADDEIGSFEPPQNIGDDMSFEPDASITESEYNPEDFPDDIGMEQNHVDEMPSEFSDEAEVLNSEQVQQENEQESTKDEGAESDLEEVQMVDETEVQDMSSQEASAEDIEVLKEQPIVADIIDSNGNVIRTYQEASSISSKKAAKNTRRKKKGLMSTLVDQYTSQ